MKVSQHLIMIALLGSMLLTSAAADILVQPGYGQPNQGAEVPKPSGELKSETPQQPKSTLAEEFERYKNLHRTIEEQLVHLIHEQYNQNLQQFAPGLVGHPLLFPRITHPILPTIGGGRLFSLTPAGAHGLHLRGFGLRRHPLLLRESADPSQQQGDCAARTQWPRSVTGGPGFNGRISGEIHDVATQPAVNADQAGGVDELNVPEIPSGDDSNVEKLVEPRQTGQRDDMIVGSPLDNIHYENSRDNKDQHHPSMPSGISSNFRKAANAVGNMIDAVAPGMMNYENKDSASAMTRNQDPASNYRHNLQYPLMSQLRGLGTGSPSIWNAPVVSNNQPMTGQSYNDQQKSQDSRLSSSTPTQSSASPKAPATYPASSSPMDTKNWLTTIQNHHRDHFYQPDDDFYYRPRPASGYPLHGNGPSSYPSGASSSAAANVNNHGSFGPGSSPYGHGTYPSGASSTATANADNRPGFGPVPSPYSHRPSYPSGASSSATANANSHQGYGNGPYNNGYPYPNSASASATANAGNSGYNYPYRSSYNNAYVAYSPYASTNFVDQYGRSLLSGLPSSINSLTSNAANYNAYLSNFVQNQLSGMYRQPVYSY